MVDQFSNDSDDDAMMALSWRRDPEESLSDWTIIVTSITTKIDDNGNYYDDSSSSTDDSEDNRIETTTKYHIHKVVVGAGPRGSKYFFRTFKESNNDSSTSSNGSYGQFASPSKERAIVKYSSPSPFRRLFGGGYYNYYNTESNSTVMSSSSSPPTPDPNLNTSHIELENSAAAAFPIMLDFMYSHTSVNVQATTKTAVALRHLAKSFDIPALLTTINEFIRKDMTKDNIHIYVQEATVYRDEEIIQSTMQTAAPAWHELFAPPPQEEPPMSLSVAGHHSKHEEKDRKHDIDGDDDDDSCCQPPASKKCRYMDLLPASKQLELLQMSILKAGSDLRGCQQELRQCQQQLATITNGTSSGRTQNQQDYRNSGGEPYHHSHGHVERGHASSTSTAITQEQVYHVQEDSGNGHQHHDHHQDSHHQNGSRHQPQQAAVTPIQRLLGHKS